MMPCADLQLWIVQRHTQRVNDTNPRQSLTDAKLYRTTLRALLITMSHIDKPVTCLLHY